MSIKAMLHWGLTFGLAALLAICYMQKNQAQDALKDPSRRDIVAVKSEFVNSYRDKTGQVKYYSAAYRYSIHSRDSCKALPAGTEYYTNINGIWKATTALRTTTICRVAPTG
jgi:hypothetical protein